MTNWTISKRIIANAVIFTLVTIVIAVVGIFALRTNANHAENRLANDALPGLTHASEVGMGTMRGHVRVLMAAKAKDAASRDKFLAQMRDASTAVTEAMNGYEAAISNPTDRANFQQLQTLRQQYATQRDAYIAAIVAGKSDEADQLLLEKFEPAFAAYRDHTLTMLQWNQDVAKSVSTSIVEESRSAYRQMATISIVGLIVALSVAAWVIRGINRTLQTVSGTLGESSSQVASAASQVSSSAQSLAHGASEQAASLEETTSSLEEMASMTKRNAEAANTAKSLSSETRTAAESGNASVEEMRRAMDAIKTSSSDIAKIIKTIDEIAFQTNILALNAAVEAARAGEAGAGFAVVAEEVRALAQRSANSAKETASKIEVAIRNGEDGALISEKVAQALSVIVEKARRVDSLVAEIATASAEQTQGIDQITKAASQMDQITQSNAGSAEESAAAAEELNAQSVAMNEAVQDLLRLVTGARGEAGSGAAAHSAPPVRPAAPTTRPRTQAASNSKLVAPALAKRPVAVAAAADEHFLDS